MNLQRIIAAGALFTAILLASVTPANAVETRERDVRGGVRLPAEMPAISEPWQSLLRDRRNAVRLPAVGAPKPEAL